MSKTATERKDSAALRPRPEVAHFEPYMPGRSMEQVRRQYGLKRVVKLASNENPLGPSPAAARALRRAAAGMHRYPDGFSTDLRKALAARLGVETADVTLGAGSDELIELLGKAYLGPGDEIVVSDHAFIRYRMAGEMMGAKVVSVPMKALTHDLPAMARAAGPRTKFIFVANPNNPTGTYNPAGDVEAFLDALPRETVAVLDEAYFEYARAARRDYPDGVDFFKAGRNVVVLRTFSKIHGLAGLRLGYGVGPRSVVETLERVRPPFNVSLAAQAAGLAAVADAGQVRRSIRLVEAERRKMEKALTAMGLEWTPSAANFLLINVAPRAGRECAEALLKRGVIVREVAEYGLPGYIRVTVGLPAENKLFLEALKKYKSASGE